MHPDKSTSQCKVLSVGSTSSRWCKQGHRHAREDFQPQVYGP
jgi:hypothetical protein